MTITGIVTFLFAVITFIVNIIKQITAVHLNISGIYVTYATNLRLGPKECFIYDVMEIKKTLFGSYKGNIVIHVNKQRNHQIKVKTSKIKPYLFEGKWSNLDDKVSSGFLQLSSNSFHDKGILSGIWTGTTKEHEVNGGSWMFHKVEEFKNKKDVLDQLYHEKKSIDESSLMIDNIVKKHEEKGDSEFNYKNISLNIEKGMFNPDIGKMSIPLLEQTLSNGLTTPDSVLDVGCGAGFYAIYFAKQGVQKVTGLDIDKQSIERAKMNAIKNNIPSSVIDFKISSKFDIFDSLSYKDKFNLIIANLPFTAQELCNDFKNSKYYNLFAINKEVLVNFLLGCQMHLHENGVVYLVFGTSTLYNLKFRVKSF